MTRSDERNSREGRSRRGPSVFVLVFGALISTTATASGPLAAQALRLDDERAFSVKATSTLRTSAGSPGLTTATERPRDFSSIVSAQTDAVEFVGGLNCSGNEVSSGLFNVSISGTVRANRSVSNAWVTGYVNPRQAVGRRAISGWHRGRPIAHLRDHGQRQRHRSYSM